MRLQISGNHFRGCQDLQACGRECEHLKAFESLRKLLQTFDSFRKDFSDCKILHGNKKYIALVQPFKPFLSMQQTETTPNFEPATKQALQEQFKIFGSRTVREEMNEIIQTMRGCSLKEAKDQKVLRASEVAELSRRLA